MAASGSALDSKLSPQNLEGYLKAELDFGWTLADMAARQDPQSGEHFGRRKRKAEAAVSTVHRFKHLLGDNRAKAELLARCSELEDLISSL